MHIQATLKTVLPFDNALISTSSLLNISEKKTKKESERNVLFLFYSKKRNTSQRHEWGYDDQENCPLGKGKGSITGKGKPEETGES